MSNITLTIPNDDHIALRAFGKALEEMALAHGAEPRNTTVSEMSYKVNIDTTEALERLNTATGELMQAAPRMMNEIHIDGVSEILGKRKEPEVDTTTHQVESLAVPVEANGATYETDLGSDNPQAVPTDDSTGTPWDERIHSTSKALNADGTWRLRRKPKDMDEAEWSTLVESVKGELSGATINDPEFVAGFDDGVKDFVTGDVIEPPVTPPGDDTLFDTDKYVYMYRTDDNTYVLGRSEKEIIKLEGEGYVRHTNEQYDAWEGPKVTDDGDDFHTDADVVTEQTVAGIPPLPVPPPVVVPPAPVDDAWTFPKLMTFLTERQGKIDVPTVNMLLAQDGIASLPELNAHPDKIGPFVARVKAHLGE